ncbi:MAG: hypothetical protein AAF799_12945 [Myxococcota bacterium]
MNIENFVWTLPSIVLLTGCPSPGINGAHCSLLEGDATCAALGTLLPYCSAGCKNSPFGNGCVAEQPPPSCHSPCGGGLTAEELDECPEPTSGTGPAPTTGMGTTAGDELPSMTATGADDTTTGPAPGCRDDASCPAASPFCREDTCVPCSATDDPNAACVESFPDRPLCVEDACVACTAEDTSACEGATPACDVPTGTCVACTRHGQCPDSACHLEAGSCLPVDRVWWVDGDARDCGIADGSEASPYCTFADAMANIGVGQLGTLRVAAREFGAAYAENLVLAAGRVVAVLSADEEPPRLTGSGIGAPITVSGGAVAYLQGGRVEGSLGTHAISVVGSVLHLHEFRVVLNVGGGIALTNGALLQADNSVLGANGNALVDAQALRVTDSSFDLRYVTLAGNDGTAVSSILCTGASNGSIRNGIVVGVQTGSVDCPDLVVETSATDSAFMGEGVVPVGTFDVAWFVSPGSGDFHLADGHPFTDVARWEVGDPPVDLDGDRRPSRAGSPDVAGADR